MPGSIRKNMQSVHFLYKINIANHITKTANNHITIHKIYNNRYQEKRKKAQLPKDLNENITYFFKKTYTNSNIANLLFCNIFRHIIYSSLDFSADLQ